MSKKISTLAVGAKVRDPLSKYYGVPVGFQIADKNHAGYPANSTTLAAEKILCLKAFDAKESGGNSDRQNYGNNRYSLANIRQWLNKSGTNWYQAQHSYDRAPGLQLRLERLQCIRHRGGLQDRLFSTVPGCDPANHADRGEAHNGRRRQRNRDRRLLPAVQAGSGPRL